MRSLYLILFSLLLSGCAQLPFGAKQQAALQVNATPGASVYLNGSHVGQTPFFDDKLKPGEYSVRLLVENDPTKDWQTTVTLTAPIVTVINRVFGSSLEESSHYLLQLEPLTQKDATELSVISLPDNVIAKVDGQPKGFTPISLKDLAEGDHVVTLTSPGYQEMVIQTQTKAGYKLAISGQLGRLTLATDDEVTATASAQLQEATTSGRLTPTPTTTPSKNVTTKPSPTAKPTGRAASDLPEKPYVEIKDTPTGWLRVRAEGSSAAEEIGKVNPGETYPYLDSNPAGWYQITLTDGTEGWISSQYATLVK
jgi:hypothetical protein